MISEKWNIKFDINRLQEHLKQFVINKEITRQSSAFGGWSVLSSDGDYKDGWQQGHLLYRKGVSEEQKKITRSQMNKKFSEYTIETEICHGYLLEVINTIRTHKLHPARARIICLTAGMSCSWHRDAAEGIYAVRLHIPIITNDGCFFETETESEHLPADGSAYFIHVNREHRVVNKGNEDRYHLVMDVFDKNNITQFHHYAKSNS
ncbi:MAG: hypothetical protein A2622_14150 [Bdellovibrionales bacterium RIFCSPHIGHO2_01_FULL_40_29]|nr:MAG: hypothetical protein A2622_14150 [Bdellovibrionales bacterium RIFCSPHIGHO2_01_FULL_40_29]OFZ33663.1 MAG: hypothetical protein A3D17_11760 [Bdellovibrionales bacterium RIFCSPHIGHO2_02_FULL_40_15]